MAWKKYGKIFHSVEKISSVFHSVENPQAGFYSDPGGQGAKKKRRAGARRMSGGAWVTRRAASARSAEC